jgi:hypothetical protein
MAMVMSLEEFVEALDADRRTVELLAPSLVAHV